MNPLLTTSPHEGDAGNLIRRDPRALSAETFRDHLPGAEVGMRAIRAKCLECCNYQTAEVRKCVCTTCPLWPLRMGAVPRGLRQMRKGGGDAEER